jgi:hypothetical protein
MTKRFWRIRGYKKFDVVFDEMIPAGCMTENQVQQLLMCLAANGSLTYKETLGAYVKRGTRRAHDLLHVQKNGPYPEYSCGHDPYFIAIIADENGDRVKYPTP